MTLGCITAAGRELVVPLFSHYNRSAAGDLPPLFFLIASS